MTDRFVPDKPGLYWISYEDILEVVDVAEIQGPNFRFMYRDWQKLTEFHWIAPVPPPDVVYGLVAALEWYEQQTKAARLIHSGGDAGRQALARDGGDKARAALQRYRGG